MYVEEVVVGKFTYYIDIEAAFPYLGGEGGPKALTKKIDPVCRILSARTPWALGYLAFGNLLHWHCCG